ncbi:DUF418 domain-containing protein [Marinicrinis sediminis]|uniref:DUF418 domain-containing protein n=1 Tax=Marinicrinis sediminis TaxID=1652465 RepID=A0ABW5RAP4_9BACL
MGSTSNRIVGFDIARALAIFGMVIVNYKISMGAEGNGAEWLIFLTGLFEGRAAAVFVILAGIGISLSTRKVRQSPIDASQIRSVQISIWKRSLFLLLLGLSLFLLGWDADILHYYACYMIIASLFIAASSRTLLWTAAGIILLAEIMQLSLNYAYGWHPSFAYYEIFWTPEGFIRNLFFNGYHPIFPWVSFMLFGMWLGRLNMRDMQLRKKLAVLALILTVGVEVFSYMMIQLTQASLEREIAQYLFWTKPMPPNLFYMIASSGTAVLVIVGCVEMAERFHQHAVTRLLMVTGQLALTLYVAHFMLLIVFDIFGLLENNSLSFATAVSFLFFLSAMLFATLWRKAFTRGPIEWLMRKVSS